MEINVIGGGLAGCEAAHRLAEAGVRVRLFEQKPLKRSPAHHSDSLCELVCSNSLKSRDPATGSGLLKEEMRLLGSLVLEVAEQCSVPAGGALAVNREDFSREVTRRMMEDGRIEVIPGEVTEIPDGITVVCTGPLTEGRLYHALCRITGEGLHFYDAAAPIVTGDSVDRNAAFAESRYGKGEGDYLNCPMNREEYEAFYRALVSAESVVLKEFEKREIFEGCMPIEVMAKRGEDTSRFGPLRPVGLRDPRTGQRPYAVVQLRREDAAGTLYNLVGFQTNLLFSEQKRVFSMIPALKNAQFVKYGVMHRNSYLNSPRVLNAYLQLRQLPRLFVGGQLCGVEGYMESAVSGLLAAENALRFAQGRALYLPPETTVTGSLMRYISDPERQNFQPMNANFGILPPLPEHIRDKAVKKQRLSERALHELGVSLAQQK